ncbi:glycoside hydrolase family 28 protein [Trinickia caryophylli]|uniref:Polygalacturonase n=1 Tax=Trinickia caryophylli TaxID=28094 RepID=A0A1X7EHH6_TRICW|nr:glycoside hydrolase family 28 protein [Trinickia caryophylli]PMS11021.1 polygalacturonase [Trinickia caryophylli]TRX14477.1 glycoside hydrolase family 28 protein [Trinickia caryophylli]WQE14316.1 glycoside hydrolase family 28 protein [Trinickia caryophylli]SMF34040.1 polygalacturonase [Trinickia caryophylli]GLU32301.1 polygalacturonase [Trinickia caryophylli]
MKVKSNALIAALAALGVVGAHAEDAPVTTQWGQVSEPAWPTTICKTLTAKRVPVNGSLDSLDASPSGSQPDTSDIQSAIANCPSGQAVKLVAGASGATGFLTGPLQLKSGVTLWIDSGVTLFASRNPKDYDTGAGTCGTATKTNDKSCKPLIVADKTTGSGIVGGGVIDGRGGSLLTNGANANTKTWWDVAWQNRTLGLNQQNPRILQVQNGSNFVLHGITLQNSPNFHVWAYGVTGLTAWGIKILTPSLVYTKAGYQCPTGTTPDVVTPATCFTPDTTQNTDGFDTGYSSKVLLAYSFISAGDDHVALKSSSGAGAQNHTYAHNHFYYGHGLSIGSETNAGVSNVAVTDLVMDGYDSGTSGGLRIKSDASRGGTVSNVTYNQVCMRNISHPLTFDPFYSKSTGSLYPNFNSVKVSGLHYLGSSKYGGGDATFVGYTINGQNNPLVITLDNVVFDNAQPKFAAGHNGGPTTQPAATHFTFGPGPVSFASSIVSSSSTGVTVTGTPGSGTAVDCSSAFKALSTVVPTSPI